MKLRFSLWLVLGALAVAGLWGPHAGWGGAGACPPAAAGKTGAVEAEGLHNVFRITDNLYSGSVPEGDAGFRSLRELGIKTILSVDGMRPDVERARRYGLRYVHLPVGYDGIPREQALKMARAVRDLPGPVYVHCHHGMHRGPAAAAVIHRFLDEGCGAEAALAEMRRAGTDPHYTGLYAAARDLPRPAPGELDRVPAEFPEVSRVADLAQLMVGVDERWDRLKLIRSAGWKTPADHPDLEPAQEALQLVEQLREAGRLPEVRRRPEEFRRLLAEAEKDARELEGCLRAAEASRVEQAFQQAGAMCVRCHARYRDVPQGR